MGNPVRYARLQPGQVVLDIGSGGGIDRGAEPVGPQEPGPGRDLPGPATRGPAALYPLFTPELIQVMRRTIPADHQDHVATGVIVKARKPG